MKAAELVDAIDALLPQTQCTKCGYSGCRPYAEAIVRGAADINQCPPGGVAAIRSLAALLGREFKPLNPANGVEQVRATALIDEGWCIGCTGCELCVPPCPVDCIHMVEAEELRRRGAVLTDPTPREHAERARARYAFHQVRLAGESVKRAVTRIAEAEGKLEGLAQEHVTHGRERKRAAVQAALERARARRAATRT